jgi:hypothetical protein
MKLTGDHREADLVGRLECRPVGRFPHPHVPDDVLDLDDGVVDQDAGDDGDGEKADEVEREAHGLHGPERRHHGERQGDGRYDRCPQVAKEDEDHDDGEDGALHQRLHRRLVDPERIGDGRVDELQLDVRMGAAQLLHLGLDLAGDRYIARPLAAADGNADDRLAVELGVEPWFRHRVADGAERIEAHAASARQRNDGLSEVGQGRLTGKGADRLLAASDLTPAPRQIDVDGPELAVDVAGRDAEGEKPVGVQGDADLARHAADALRLGDALHAQQRAGERVVHEPGQLLGRERGSARRVGQYRQAFDVEPLDDGLVDGAGQLAADAGDGVLDVVDGAIDRRLELEFDHGGRSAFYDGGGDVLDAGDTGDGILDALGNLGLELGRRRPRLRDLHLHDGHVDIRKARDRKPPEAEEAECQQHHEKHERGHRAPDGPGRDVEPGHALPRVDHDLVAVENGAHGIAVAQKRPGLGDHELALGQALPDLDLLRGPQAGLHRARGHRAVSDGLHEGAIVRVEDGAFRHGKAAARRRDDGAAGEGADAQVAAFECNPHAAEPRCRPPERSAARGPIPWETRRP